MQLNKPVVRFTISFILISALLTACGAENRRLEPNNLYWPPPPDLPRIKYIQSVYCEDDIGREYSLKEMLFGKDTGVDFLMKPYGVFSIGNRIYVTDLVLKGILVFDLDAKRVRLSGVEGSLKTPSSVVADSTGTVYVADAGGAKIVVYDERGIYRTAFLLPGSRPVAAIINAKLGRLYVVDRNANMVLALDLEGNKLFEFGGPGDADGKFHLPLGIAVDADGTLYVLDSGNFRVQIFDPQGVFLAKFGSVGDGPGMFANPKGIALDSEGHIYVTDAAFGNFQVFDRQGRFLLFVGSLGPAPGQFHLPSGIAIDEKDRIYVADQFNRRIEVFQYLKAQ
jgi:DNA-binding beta-propeller fold protein YncE